MIVQWQSALDEAPLGDVCTVCNIRIESPLECVQGYRFEHNFTDFILNVIRIAGNLLDLIPIMVRIPSNLPVNCG